MFCTVKGCHLKRKCDKKNIAESCVVYQGFIKEVYTEGKFFLIPKRRLKETDEYALIHLDLKRADSFKPKQIKGKWLGYGSPTDSKRNS